jgi:hypothetical protein
MQKRPTVQQMSSDEPVPVSAIAILRTTKILTPLAGLKLRRAVQDIGRLFIRSPFNTIQPIRCSDARNA